MAERPEDTVPSLTGLASSVEILSARIHYSMMDPGAVAYDHERWTTIRASTPTRFYEMRQAWTGSADSQREPSVLSNTNGTPHRLHGPAFVEGSFTYYLIDLAERVPSGDEVEIHTQQRLLDNARIARPFLRFFVRDQAMRQLRLEVSLVTPLIRKVHPTLTHGLAGQPLSTHGLDFSVDEQSAVLNVENPEYGLEYGIAWP